MDMYQSLAGMVVAELTAADLNAALQDISCQGVRIYGVEQKSDLTVFITLRRGDLRIAETLCHKKGYTLRPLGRKGLYWKFASFLKRPVLLMGSCIMLFLILFLPTRVLFVKVEGNDRIPSRQIIEAAENCGISFGASRRRVRSERVKNALLEALPELQWAGVNSKGCVAVISVREKTVASQLQATAQHGNVVASREGIILSATATRGNLICQPGQAVSKGQILISGYTDCGLKIELCAAEGEVRAKTVRHLEVILPAVYRSKEAVTETQRSVSLLVGKKRINLWKDSGIWDGSCGRIYEENYITLPGGFQLPFGWSVDTFFYGDLSEYPLSEAEALLEAFASEYLTKQMIGGAVLSQNVRVTCEEERYRLTGEYVCAEMIGIRQAEKIGEGNGKSG